jgi:catechol 2,3-dioxygenase-like lactoylglutathione lyase family enzyme
MVHDIDAARLSRRQLLKTVAMGAAVAGLPELAVAKSLGATAIDHVSYESSDYKKTRDFYASVFGFRVSEEDDRQLYLWAGDALISAKNTPAARRPRIDHFGVTVDPWDSRVVAAVLEERRLPARFQRNDPHDPGGRSAFTRDQDGFALQLDPKDLAIRPAPTPSSAPLKAIGINHISYQCRDYRKARDFYTDLLGVTVSNDDGKQAYLWFGDVFMAVRNGANADTVPAIDYVAWTLADWDVARVSAELKRHALDARPDATGRSVTTKDINGYTLQLCSKELGRRPS